MAVIETWLRQDLNRLVSVQSLQGQVFSLDNSGNLIGVRVTKDGEPVSLAGTVTGYCILSDGQTVNVTGSGNAGIQNGNEAYIVLPQLVYSVPGQISIVIKLTQNSTITTLAACTGYVYRSRTDNEVVPAGTPIPDLSTLEEAIANANAATASANTAAAAAENVDVSMTKEGDVITIAVTDRDGVTTTETLSDQSEAVADLKSAINQIENEVLTEINLVDTSDWVHASSSNAAITNNNDGTFTFDTSDYGTTVWQTSENVPAGDYIMCGVPYGFIVVSPTTSYSSGYIEKNNTNDPAEFTNPSNQKLYLVARSNSNPSSDYTVAPYIKTKTGNVVHIMQGVENAGKALIVGEDGKVIPDNVSIDVDDTLTIDGAAADAKATGDRIGKIEEKIQPIVHTIHHTIPVSGTLDGDIEAHMGVVIPKGVNAKITVSTDILYRGDQIAVQYNDKPLMTSIRQTFSGHTFYDAPFTMDIPDGSSYIQTVRVSISHIESTSGNIDITVTFTSGENLVGMENVLPYKTGKNLIDPSLAYRYVSLNNGYTVKATSDLSACWVPISAGETISFNKTISYMVIVDSLYDGTYDPSGIVARKSKITNAENDDGYVIFIIQTSDLSDLIAVSGEYPADYKPYNPIGGYVEDAHDSTYGTISMYYPDEGENIKRIDSNQSANRFRFRFVHISDTHQSSDTPIKCIGEFTDLSSAKFLTLTGDIVNDNIANDASKTTDQILAMTKPCYICMGNHDVWGDTNPTQRYTKYFNPIAEHNGLDEDISYYAVDFATEHVKCIWLDIYELSTNTPSFQMSSAQINWFLSQLDDAITNSYHVCVFLHQPLTAIGKPIDSFYDASLLNAPETNLKWILDTVNAFQNKDTVEFTHNGNSFSHTFTGEGVFVAYFNGHTHYDSVGWLKDYNQFNVTVNRFQTNGEAYDTVYRNEKLRIAANYVAIDTYARRLSVVRVGNNNTIAGIKRDAFTVIY